MSKFLIFQSDFGLGDGAVSAMYGVANGVDDELKIYDLTHDITAYNIFEGSYRLFQTINYWPEGSVFVSVVDPGVGTKRTSVVAKVKGNKYIVTPNNGTLTHVAKFIGIEEIRIIDETKNRLKGSELSYTFHGRDVYAYTGARLASGKITFEEVGQEYDEPVMLELFGSKVEGNSVTGQVDILDVRFGSLWTSIEFGDFKSLGFVFGDNVKLSIYKEGKCVYESVVAYQHSFGDVSIGSPVVYMNSVNHMAVAINQGNFADAYRIGVGSNWKITMSKV